MPGFMQPPVADEVAPRSWRTLVLTTLALVILLITVFRLARAPIFDESAVQPIRPATEETNQQAAEAVRNKEVMKAYALALPHAEAGNLVAQRYVGRLYERGFNGDYLRDHCKAAIWFDKAAHNGDSYSMARMADFYVNGVGVKRDAWKAYLWYRQSLQEAVASNETGRKRALDRVQSALPKEYQPAEGSPQALELDKIFAAWNYRDEPHVVINPLPDIPVIDFFAEIFWANGQGCHGAYPN